LLVSARHGLERDVHAEVELLVIDCGEDMILPYSLMRNTGLLKLLDPVEDASKSSIESVGEDGEQPNDPQQPDNMPFIANNELKNSLHSLCIRFADLFDQSLEDAAAWIEPMAIELIDGKQLKVSCDVMSTSFYVNSQLMLYDS
jgi:hypothetical protein